MSPIASNVFHGDGETAIAYQQQKNLPIASFNTGSMIRICTSAEALKRKDGHICRVRHCAHSGHPFTHTASCLISSIISPTNLYCTVFFKFILYGVLILVIIRAAFYLFFVCIVMFSYLYFLFF